MMKRIYLTALLLSALFGLNGSLASATEADGPLQMESLSLQPDSSILKSIVNKVIDKVTTVSEEDLFGTWHYTGSDCSFKSDDLLKKAGGELASKQIESKLDETLAKVGIKEGVCSFTFNEDKSFSALLGKKTLTGTYEYDTANKTMTLTFLKLAKMTAQVKKEGSEMGLLFDADKLLTLLTAVSSLTNMKSVNTLGKLAAQYDGLLLGFQLEK